MYLKLMLRNLPGEPQRKLPGQYSNRVPPETLPLHKIGRHLVRSYPLIFNFWCMSYVLSFVRRVIVKSLHTTQSCRTDHSACQ